MYSWTLAEQVHSKFTGTDGTDGGTDGTGSYGTGTDGTVTYGTGTDGSGTNGTGRVSLLQNSLDDHPNPSPIPRGTLTMLIIHFG